MFSQLFNSSFTLTFLLLKRNLIIYYQQHPNPEPPYEFPYPSFPFPFPYNRDYLLFPIFPDSFYLSFSSAVIEFYFLINALVISKNASSTPYPTLALVLSTFK